MDLDRLLNAIQAPKSIQEHPDWAEFKTRKFPQFISFYYTNQEGHEAYWDNAKIIKLDLKKLHLIIEGAHQDPLKFEIPKIMHCKDAKTGEKVQDIFFELTRMWNDIYQPED